jgi:hypothetical protein
VRPATLPESEAHRLDGQRQVIEDSLHRLTALAEAAGQDRRGQPA